MKKTALFTRELQKPVHIPMGRDVCVYVIFISYNGR